VSKSLLHHIAFYAKDSQFVQILNRLKFFNLQQFVEAYIQNFEVLNISELVEKRYAIVAQYNLSQTLKSSKLHCISYQIMRRIQDFETPEAFHTVQGSQLIVAHIQKL
jgi:hypothetical protein